MKDIIYPPWISKKMVIRFNNLEFRSNENGFLYSLRSYDDNWDFQTKALWLRSVGVTPENIAKRLNLNVNTLKNKEFLGLLTLDYPNKNFEIIVPNRYDWATIGYIDRSNNRHIYFGGTQDIRYHARAINDDDGGLTISLSPQLQMDGELLQFLRSREDKMKKKAYRKRD